MLRELFEFWDEFRRIQENFWWIFDGIYEEWKSFQKASKSFRKEGKSLEKE